MPARDNPKDYNDQWLKRGKASTSTTTRTRTQRRRRRTRRTTTTTTASTTICFFLSISSSCPSPLLLLLLLLFAFLSFLFISFLFSVEEMPRRQNNADHTWVPSSQHSTRPQPETTKIKKKNAIVDLVWILPEALGCNRYDRYERLNAW